MKIVGEWKLLIVRSKFINGHDLTLLSCTDCILCLSNVLFCAVDIHCKHCLGFLWLGTRKSCPTLNFRSMSTIPDVCLKGTYWSVLEHLENKDQKLCKCSSSIGNSYEETHLDSLRKWSSLNQTKRRIDEFKYAYLLKFGKYQLDGKKWTLCFL